MASTTIFERAGGFATVRRVVSSFYERVLDSPALAHYFEHIDMRRLIDHQTKFISAVMGGPGSFTDDHLRRVHQHLGISHDEFAEVADHLRAALEEYDVAPDDVAAVEAAVRRREPVIVTGD
ncbi:MAG TPA: group 1 truncated hemoglobin [Candidatus Limnocylindrales bacterium]|nr:group 1 truncated hemoglobin [Candidatus Limnocylindrales bacterium]